VVFSIQKDLTTYTKKMNIYGDIGCFRYGILVGEKQYDERRMSEFTVGNSYKSSTRMTYYFQKCAYNGYFTIP